MRVSVRVWEPMRLAICISVSLALIGCVLLNAQEIKYLDLTVISQRTQLRYPAAPPSDCEVGIPCVGSGRSGVGIADGAPNPRDPHALGVYLERVAPTDIDVSQPFEAEFKVLNTGLAPIELPVSPHLLDLQPDAESVPFDYFSLDLLVRAVSLPGQPELVSYASVVLYGSADHEGTMLVLKPGEWIRVRAKMKLHGWPSESMDTRLRGQFWFRENTFRPHPGGAFTDIHNLYPNGTITPGILAHLFRSSKEQQ